jgi:hypothetical protein
VAACFLHELDAGGQSEFGVDVAEVGLHTATALCVGSRFRGGREAPSLDAPAEGVTLYITEVHPTSEGYDFAELNDVIARRDQNR